MSNADRTVSRPFRVIEDRLDKELMPISVRESLEQHHEHLSRLADDLKKLGMHQQQIDEHVVAIFREYECELEANIERIRAAEENRQNRKAS